MKRHTARRIFALWAAGYTPGGVGRGVVVSRVLLRRNRPHLFAPRVSETFRGEKWGMGWR